MFIEELISENSWKKILKNELKKDYVKYLEEFLHNEYEQNTIYPLQKNIFKALNTTPFNKVKVIILGQDPYHGKNQANGLAFSVNSNITFPPSLKNIFKELSKDMGFSTPLNGVLDKWADQGVLLLNTTLTVRESVPGSHKNKGWEKFTDYIVKSISDKKDNIIFLLWGKEAEKKIKLIDTTKHKILLAPHPSPLSVHRGFFGCKHFSKTNKILVDLEKTPINWKLD